MPYRQLHTSRKNSKKFAINDSYSKAVNPSISKSEDEQQIFNPFDERPKDPRDKIKPVRKQSSENSTSTSNSKFVNLVESLMKSGSRKNDGQNNNKIKRQDSRIILSDLKKSNKYHQLSKNFCSKWLNPFHHIGLTNFKKTKCYQNSNFCQSLHWNISSCWTNFMFIFKQQETTKFLITIWSLIMCVIVYFTYEICEHLENRKSLALITLLLLIFVGYGFFGIFGLIFLLKRCCMDDPRKRMVIESKRKNLYRGGSMDLHACRQMKGLNADLLEEIMLVGRG